MRTRIKICCIASPEEAELAIAAGADALGLVAAMPSGPGPISDDMIARVAAQVPPPVATFLLTNETSAEAIADHVRRTGPTAVQVVNHIAPLEAARLAKLVPATRRVQVIHVEDAGALDLIDAYAPHVHAFLLDSGRPGLAVPELGGTGRVHDWDVSASFVVRSKRPVFLAGGLNAGNVGDAIAKVRPYGLDLCSALRTNGALDAGKLQAFIDAVARADMAR
ncbi:N-(5'-phosphoribosyl)anthranilate isomerase [Polymorphobacter multimanifer]|uniref:N-(5'-phosphoribosyl)anthranilate isomerase n=1 Tax=Polymorphobacter multimanifer TaxID=1070431 RepID=A0A841LBM7_9SPHN|nr:phosphoribosylanthranilate isomerase [Polymorphobacter multimanifer]MBB6226408.1 phosphoribosylanthranilate isomerase [Polymorphobacter multimanifer]GGI67864.1 N-(5'-phosphoribosyl)anthranilate isomerase [Polymorphobacter multimanifer]